MNHFLRLLALVPFLAFTAPLAHAQAPQITQTPTTLTGSVPSQIAAAHKIFLSSAGADPNFPLDPAHVYNDIYTQLKAWGRYELVGSAEQADLVFTLRGVAPITQIAGVQGDVNSYTTPAFELIIVDAPNNKPIWTVTSPIALAGRKGRFDHWAAIAETNLVSRVKVLAGQPLTNTETANLTMAPKSHAGLAALVIVGGTVGLAAGSYFLIHHLYENGLADGKAQQDAFCKANNIPLSMCAGG